MRPKLIVQIAVLCVLLSAALLGFGQASQCAKTDYDCQIKQLRTQIAADPKNTELYYNLALALSNKGEYTDSITMLNTYLTSGITNREYLADGYSLRGYAQRNLENYERAVADYTTAIGYASANADYYLNRGRSYNDLKKFDLGILDFNKAISLDPKNVSAYFGRGFAYMSQKNNPPAIDDFTRAIALDSNESEAFYNRGTIYYGQQKYAMAIADLSKYIGLNAANAKNMADGYVNRGLSYFYFGNTNQAIADYTKAIELSPSLKNAYTHRAEAYRKAGKIALAEADEKKASQLD